jgi:hypothetical protein
LILGPSPGGNIGLIMMLVVVVVVVLMRHRTAPMG